MIACEPVPKTFSLLNDNVRLNRLDDLVDLYQVAVGEKSGQVLMTSDLHGRNHVIKDGGTSVSMVTLDELVGDREPVALKIDVEGYEALILRGAAKVLGKES